MSTTYTLMRSPARKIFTWTREELSICLPVAVLERTQEHIIVAIIGWGWDKDQPLRPWPDVKHFVDGPRRERMCVAWFGLFLHMAKLSRKPEETVSVELLGEDEAIVPVGTVPLPELESSIPGHVRHIHCDGSRSHVLSWSFDRGGAVVHCSEPRCVKNARSRKSP